MTVFNFEGFIFFIDFMNSNNRKNQNHTTDFQRTHTVKFVPRLAVYDEQNLLLTIQNKVTFVLHGCQNYYEKLYASLIPKILQFQVLS